MKATLDQTNFLRQERVVQDALATTDDRIHEVADSIVAVLCEDFVTRRLANPGANIALAVYAETDRAALKNGSLRSYTDEELPEKYRPRPEFYGYFITIKPDQITVAVADRIGRAMTGDQIAALEPKDIDRLVFERYDFALAGDGTGKWTASFDSSRHFPPNASTTLAAFVKTVKGHADLAL